MIVEYRTRLIGLLIIISSDNGCLKKEMDDLKYIWITLTIWNLIVFFLYGYDKWKSRNQGWRISERTLILAAWFLGGPGAFLGMRFFHHKTKHVKFKILVPLALLCNVLLLWGVAYLTM